MMANKNAISEILAWCSLALGLLTIVAFGIWTEMSPPSASQRELDPASLKNLQTAWQLLGGGTGVTASQLVEDPQRLERALSLIDKELQKDPRSSEAHRLLGLHAVASGELDKAHKALERSLQLNPRRLDTMLALAVVHAEREDHEAAEKILRTAVDLYPDSIAALHNLGQTVWMLGREDEATEIYQRKIELQKAAMTPTH